MPTRTKNYIQDNLDRLTQVTGATTENYAYDAANRLISKSLPNGMTTSYLDDGMSRLRQLKDEKAGTGVLSDRL